MCTYLKNMEGYKLKDLKLKEFDSIQEMFDRALKRQNVEDDKETTELKQLMKIIPDEEEVAIDVIPLAVKSPTIVDCKIYKEGRKSYYQIMKADGKSQMYMIFSQMLKSFDREDLEELYKLVKAKYESTRPVEDLDLLLWGDLKTMFEPHVEDKIYMLVEKKYLLAPLTLSMMLERKLIIDYESEMAYQLLKFIMKQLKKGRGCRRGGQGYRLNVDCYNCGKHGHYAKDCRSPKRTKEKNHLVTEPQVEESGILLMAHEEQILEVDTMWYLDSGASNHMSGQKDLFVEMIVVVQGYVSFERLHKDRCERTCTEQDAHDVFIPTALSDPTMVTTDSENNDEPIQPRMRSLQDIYNNTTKMHLVCRLAKNENIIFEEAIRNKKRKEAMDEEISAIEKNKTWEMAKLPKGHKPIGVK
ncbi:putative ribonuclease H-like domain-containing protein [Tanacetum coccineum]